MERPAPTTGRPFAFVAQAFRQLTQSLNETLIVTCQLGGMDPINAYPAAADHAARRLVTPPKPADSNAPFTPNRDGAAAATATARKPEPLAPKPDQVKNREADEQVTRQRVQDKAQGTMFDLSA